MQALIKNTTAYTLVKAEAEEGRLSHAYLLLLDDKRNLRTALKTFAKAVLDCDVDEYDEEDSNPFFDEFRAFSDKKRMASLIDSERFSDCLFFPEDGKRFSVEDAEKVMEESLLMPVEGGKKLFIISDFADATVQAQNKLLKLLEEPPQSAVFLLGATVLFPVLETVRSRTEKLEIHPFLEKQILSCLQRIYGSQYRKDEYELCAAVSCGSVGGAQDILENGYYTSLSDLAFSLCRCNASTLPTLAKKAGDSKNKNQLLALLRIIYKDALLLKTGNEKYVSLKIETERLQKIKNMYKTSVLVFAQEAISTAEQHLKFNANFNQCIEVCMASILQKNK